MVPGSTVCTHPSTSICSSFIKIGAGRSVASNDIPPARRQDAAIKKRGPVNRTPPKSTETQSVTIATPAAATAAATVFTARTAASATAGTFFPGTGDVDREGAAIQLAAVQSVNRLLSFLRGTHGDEGKAARAAAHFVHHQVGFDDRSVRCECVLQVIFSRVEGKISYKQFRAHVTFCCPRLTVAFSRLFPVAGFQIITEPSSLEDLPCRGSDKLSIRQANTAAFRPKPQAVF